MTKIYNHSGWLNNSGSTYIFADENHGYEMKICDVTNPNEIIINTTFLSGVDSNSMAHNLIIKDNYVYVSHYHDGLWVWDISNPSNPVVVGNFDTYLPEDHDSYRGAWGVYPLLPSGNILVSDMQSGLFVLSPIEKITILIFLKIQMIILYFLILLQINLKFKQIMQIQWI